VTTTGADPADAGSRAAGALALVLLVSAVLPTFLISGLAVEMRREFPLGDATLGLAVALSYAVATLTSAPAGRLTDRMGAARSIHLGIALASGCSLTVALLVDSAAGLVATVTVAGLANAISVPAASGLVSRRVPGDRQGRAIGMQHAGAPAGALLAGLALPLVAVPFGWRWAFAAAAVVPLLALPIMRSMAMTVPVTVRRGERDRMGLRPVHLLALAAALANIAATGMVAFLVVYAVESGVTVAVAGVLLAATSFAAGATRILLGMLVDAGRGRPLGLVAALLGLGAVGYPLLATGEAFLIAAGALVAGGIGWAWPGLMALGIIRTNPDEPGAAVGVGMMGIYAGACIGPLAVGLVAQHASFTSAWLAATPVALLAAVVAAAAQRLEDAQDRPGKGGRYRRQARPAGRSVDSKTPR